MREKSIDPQLICRSRTHKELAVVACAGGVDHDGDAYDDCDEDEDHHDDKY